MNKIYQKSFSGDKDAGFTLIELLVVVLIVGILAAIALPQYENAVLKSKYTQLMVLADAFKKAEDRYYMANGEYTFSFEDLDVSPPAGWTLDRNGKSIQSPKGYGCTLQDGSGHGKILTVYCSTESATYFLPVNGERWCGVLNQSAKADRLCRSLGGELASTNQGGTYYYRLP